MNSMNLEEMSATGKAVEALKARGFFVEEVNGVIKFSECSAEGDRNQVLYILNRLDIPYAVKQNQTVEIWTNSLPNSIFKKIFQFGGSPFQVPFYSHQENWRYFTSKRFGMRVDALDLEYNMARFVKAANMAGIATFAGCNGHLKHSPRFQLSGVFNGAWFNVIQQLYMGNLKLNYRWKILYQGHTQAELRVMDETEWNQHLIHQDTLKMAEVLEKHSREIRALKKKVFSKHQIAPKEFFQRKQYFALENWMMERLLNTDGLSIQLKNRVVLSILTYGITSK